MFSNRNRNNEERHPHDELAHVHEVEGAVQLGGNRCHPHIHCFEAVTSRGIPCGDLNHYHEVEFTTDINECHCHKFCGRTGPAIQAGNGEHIHIIESITSCNDGHRHCIKVATGTEEPVGC